MATNLKIAHPDAILRAKCYQSDHNRNMINGPRDLWQAVVAGTVSDSYYALPYNETMQAEFLYIARIDATVRASSNDVTVELLGAPDDSANDESESAAIGTEDLMGPYSEDYLLATTFASAYRFWQVQITTSDSIVHSASSIYFGTFFDMGRPGLSFAVSDSLAIGRAQETSSRIRALLRGHHLHQAAVIRRHHLFAE